MEYANKNGLKISRLTLGTVQLGLNYGIANNTGKPDEQASFRILKASVENGVNSFDTASTYGASEEVLGKFFAGNTDTLSEPVIVTKVSGIDFNSDQTIKESILGQVEGSLKRLGLSRIPVLMIHFFSDYKKGRRTIIESLNELKLSGKVGKAGISVYTEDDVESILKDDVLDAVQIPLNIFDHQLVKSGMLKEFKKRDMIVFVRSVFLQGLFFLDPDKLPENLQIAREPLKKLHGLAKRTGMSIAQFCTSFVKNLDGVSSLVIGCETVDQVLNNISLVENSGVIPTEIYNEIFQCFGNMPQKIINPYLWGKSK